MQTSCRLLGTPCLQLSIGRAGKRVGRAGENYPDALLFSSSCNLFAPVLLMFFYCPLVVLLRVFIGRGCQPISSRTLFIIVLRFSCLLFLFSSWSSLGLLLARSPVALLSFWRSQVTACPSFVLLVRPCCFPSLILLYFVVLLMSSSGLSVVLLLSGCLRCFPRSHDNSNSCWLSLKLFRGLCWYN